VIFMPMEATGLLASIGGIAELAKDAMQQQQGSATPRVPSVGGPAR